MTTTAKTVPALSDLLDREELLGSPDAYDIEGPDWMYDARSMVVDQLADRMKLQSEDEEDEDYNYEVRSAVESAITLHDAAATLAYHIKWAKENSPEGEAEKILEWFVGRVGTLVNG